MSITNFVKNAAILARNPGLRTDVQGKLKKLGLNIVKSTAHGGSAFDEFKQPGTVVDLIIMDPILSDYDAKSFLTELRAHDNTFNTHVFIMCVDDELSLIPELLSFGLSGYIKKPFSGENLGQMLLSRFGRYYIYQQNFHCICNDTAAIFFENFEQPQLAMKYYLEIQKRVQNPQTYFDIGRLHAMKKEKEQALENFAEASKLDKNYTKIIAKFLERYPLGKEDKVTLKEIPQQAIKLYDIPANNFANKFYAVETIQQAVIVGLSHDERVNIKSLLVGLKVKHVQITDAGDAAVTMFKNSKIDMAIIGLQMSDMNGLEFLSALAKVTDIDEISILLLMDEEMSGNLEQAFELGIDGFAFKPYSLNKVCMSLHTMMVQKHFTILSGESRRLAKAAYYFMQLEQNELALNLIRQACDTKPDDAVCLFYYAQLLQLKGDGQGAIRNYSLAQEHCPELEPLIMRTKSSIDRKVFEKQAKNFVEESDSSPIEESNSSVMDEELDSSPITQESIEQKQVKKPDTSLADRTEPFVDIDLANDLEIEDESSKIDFESIALKQEGLALETVKENHPNLSHNYADDANISEEPKQTQEDFSQQSYDSKEQDFEIEDFAMPLEAMQTRFSKSAQTKNAILPKENIEESKSEIEPPQYIKPELFNTNLVDTANFSTHAELDSTNISDILAGGFYDVIDPALSKSAKTNAFEKLNFGVAPAHYALIGNIEQIVSEHESSYALKGGISVKTIGTQVSEWKFTEQIKDDSEKLYHLREVPNIFDVDRWQGLADSTSSLLSQAKLFNARILSNPENQELPISCSSYLDTVGRVLSSKEVVDALAFGNTPLPVELAKMVKKVQAGKADPQLFEELGKKMIETGYLEKMFSQTEYLLASVLAKDDTKELLPKEEQGLGYFMQSISKLREPMLKLHSDLFKGKEKFMQNIPLLVDKLDKSPANKELFAKALSFDHHSIDSFKKLYVALKKRKNEAAVAELYKMEFANLLKHDSTGFALSNFLLAVNDYDRAYEVQLALHNKKSNKNNLALLRSMALTSFKQKKYSDTVKWAKQIIALDHKNEEAYNLIGISHKKMKNFRRSVWTYQKGIKYNPESFKLYYNLAIVLANMGKKKDSDLALKTSRKFQAIQENMKDSEKNSLGEIQIS